MHENQVLGVVRALLPLPLPGVVSRLGVAALPTGTDVEDAAPGEQGFEEQWLGAGAGGD